MTSNNDIETVCDHFIAELASSLTIQLEKNDLIQKIQEGESANDKLRQKMKQIKQVKDKLVQDSERVQQNLRLNESDGERMNKAKEFYEIGKSYTGIRWDYAAPENISKGYISNKEKRVLQPFNFERSIGADIIEEKLWTLIEESASCDWSQFDADISALADKEIFSDNK